MDQDVLSFVTQKLHQRKEKITCAESCTGGILSAHLTRLAGSSEWFDMSFITYSNEAKQRILDVQADTLKFYGAVSENVVREMALGALIKTKAHYALAISGIAGPSGGTEEKPIGTVWFALATKQRIFAECQHFEGNRDQIRAKSATYALHILARYLQKLES